MPGYFMTEAFFTTSGLNNHGKNHFVYLVFNILSFKGSRMKLFLRTFSAAVSYSFKSLQIYWGLRNTLKHHILRILKN